MKKLYINKPKHLKIWKRRFGIWVLNFSLPHATENWHGFEKFLIEINPFVKTESKCFVYAGIPCC